jgi:FxsC-like protein
VLVVDPWAARDQAIGKRLRQLDREPVHVLAPFNTDDRQTAEAAAGLTEDLVEVLPEGTALRGSALGIASPHAFRDALPKAVNEAFSRYLRTTSVHPPRTPPSTTHRPTLRDPDA